MLDQRTIEALAIHRAKQKALAEKIEALRAPALVEEVVPEQEIEAQLEEAPVQDPLEVAEEPVHEEDPFTPDLRGEEGEEPTLVEEEEIELEEVKEEERPSDPFDPEPETPAPDAVPLEEEEIVSEKEGNDVE